MRTKSWFSLAVLAAAFGSGVASPVQKTKAKAKAAPATPVELVLQGKTEAAVAAVSKTPDGADATLRAVVERADTQVTDRKLVEARTTLDAAQRFADEYLKRNPRGALAREPLEARRLRLAGIELSDQKEYGKAEETLRRALQLAERSRNVPLQAAVRNNLGHALRLAGKERDAVKEFLAARNIAEEAKDNPRAGAYNFNLGLALYQSKSFEQAFDAFKRSAEQNLAADNKSIHARALLWQGRSLSAVNSVSAEPLKYFDQAQKLFQQLGDDASSGWCFYYMGDHIAYSFNFTQAAKFGESAIGPFTKAGDKNGLAATYDFLADMFARLQETQKSESYKKKALEVRAPESAR